MDQFKTREEQQAAAQATRDAMSPLARWRLLESRHRAMILSGALVLFMIVTAGILTRGGADPVAPQSLEDVAGTAGPPPAVDQDALIGDGGENSLLPEGPIGTGQFDGDLPALTTETPEGTAFEWVRLFLTRTPDVTTAQQMALLKPYSSEPVMNAVFLTEQEWEQVDRTRSSTGVASTVVLVGIGAEELGESRALLRINVFRIVDAPSLPEPRQDSFAYLLRLEVRAGVWTVTQYDEL